MTDLPSIVAAHAAASGAWRAADWTHHYVPACTSSDHGRCSPCLDCGEYVDDDGEPVECFGARPDCQVCADAAEAATAAEGFALEAMSSVRRLEWDEAVARAEAAVEQEAQFGDAPTWRPFLKAIEEAHEQADERLERAKALNDDLQYTTPPANRGQIVDVSYTSDEDGVYEKTCDRSDGSVRYQFALWDDVEDDELRPWERAPDVAEGAWRNLGGS